MEAAVLLDARQYTVLDICGLCRHHLRVRWLRQCLSTCLAAEHMSDQAEVDQHARDSSLETGRDATEEPQSRASPSKAAHPRAPALLPENKRKGRAGTVQRKASCASSCLF